jgi:hypothetical protein
MKPLVAAAFLLLALPTGHAQAAIDCKKPENLTELQSCWKLQDTHRIIAVFRAAGESSGYWKCLIDQFTIAGKQAEAAKDPIDTSDEYNRVIIGAEVTCEPYFSAFETDLRKEAGNQGYTYDVGNPDNLKLLVYQLWFNALADTAYQSD